MRQQKSTPDGAFNWQSMSTRPDCSSAFRAGTRVVYACRVTDLESYLFYFQQDLEKNVWSKLS